MEGHTIVNGKCENVGKIEALAKSDRMKISCVPIHYNFKLI